MRLTSSRAVRMAARAKEWAEAHAVADVERIAEAVVAEGDRLHRDLRPDEIERVCSATVAAMRHAEEQRAAEEARRSAAEEERLAYLRRRAADYRLAADPSLRRGG